MVIPPLTDRGGGWGGGRGKGVREERRKGDKWV